MTPDQSRLFGVTPHRKEDAPTGRVLGVSATCGLCGAEATIEMTKVMEPVVRLRRLFMAQGWLVDARNPRRHRCPACR